MVNYEEVSEAIYLLRKKLVIVIYHGTKTNGELYNLRKLKGFVFLSDKWNFYEYIGGLECCGLIIEPDVKVTDENLSYALTRLRCNLDDLVCDMSHAHKAQIESILDGYTDSQDNLYIQNIKRAFGIYSLTKLSVEDRDEFDLDSVTEPEVTGFYPELIERYRELLTHNDFFYINEFDNSDHLLWMLNQLEKNKEQSLTKKHRWLGYIQHALVSAGLTDVTTERDLTRSVFNGA